MENTLIVNNIKHLCRQNGISVSSLEKQLALSPGLISRWSKVTPSLDRLIDISHFFNVSIDAIIGNQLNHSVESKEQQLIDLLLKKSISGQLQWHLLILDDDNPSIEFGQYILSLCGNTKDSDCFYTQFDNGLFLLQIIYAADNGNIESLTLYTIPDKHTQPFLQCSDYNLLRALHQFIKNNLDDDISRQKSEIFVKRFMNVYENVSNTPHDTADISKICRKKVTKIS